jgi:glycosyltransferase involved in cell wall biosynthesis
LKVLFIVPHPIEGPSTRYRVWQYLPYLQSHGIDPTVRAFVDSSKFYHVLYCQGQVGLKVAYTIRSMIRRLTDLLRLHQFDCVFIHREALPIGRALFERLVSLASVPIIYDFDDTIYLSHASDANRWIGWLKEPDKTADIIGCSTHVIVGNEVLHSYATRFNKNVTVIPTSINIDSYTIRPTARPDHGPITIGWIGSGTTVKYLHQLDRVFQKLAQRYAIRVIVVGGQYKLPGVNVICRPWSLGNELSDLHSFDIGVMPLPDNEWTRGKCGLKALQYMGVGVPAVVSPVGVNSKIVTDGVNGYLADSDKIWLARISALIEDPSLRRRLGLAGRATVEEQYSIEVNAPKLLSVFRVVTNNKSQPRHMGTVNFFA